MKEVVIYRVDILKRVAFFVVIGVIASIFFSIKWHYTYLNYQFKGIVDSIYYDDKQSVNVIIKGQKYHLNDEWAYDSRDTADLIKKGDLLIKNKDSVSVRLIKPNGKIIKK